MSVVSGVPVAAAGVAWAVVVARAGACLRRPASLARRSLWLTALALAAAWTSKIDGVFAGLDRLTGVPDLAQVVGDVAGLATGAAILTVLVAQREPAGEAGRHARRLWGGFGALAASMAVAFLIAHFEVETRQFTVVFAAEPRYWAYETPYLAAGVLIFGGLAVWAARYAGAAPSRVLAAGMTATAAGGVFGLVYVASRVVFTLGVVAGAHGWQVWYAPLSAGTAAAASLLALGGAFLPSLGPRAARHQNRRACAALLPLWRDLHGADLMDALIDPDGPDGRRDPAFTVRRLVVEIDDGLLRLRPWLARPIGWDQTPGSGPATTARTAAADIADALHRRAAGEPAAAGAARTGPPGSSPDAETRWLRRVSRAYAATPGARDRHASRAQAA